MGSSLLKHFSGIMALFTRGPTDHKEPFGSGYGKFSCRGLKFGTGALWGGAAANVTLNESGRRGIPKMVL
jgi:hypothetical protein